MSEHPNVVERLLLHERLAGPLPEHARTLIAELELNLLRLEERQDLLAEEIAHDRGLLEGVLMHLMRV